MQFSKMALKTSFALKGLDRVDGEAEAEAKVGTEAAVGAAVGAVVGVGIGVEDEARAEAGNWFLLSVNSKLSALHLSIRCDPQLSSFCSASLYLPLQSLFFSLFQCLLNSVFFSFLSVSLPLFFLWLCHSGLPSITFHFVLDFVFLSFCLSVDLFLALSFFPLFLHFTSPFSSSLPSSSPYLPPSSPPSSSCPAFLITLVLFPFCFFCRKMKINIKSCICRQVAFSLCLSLSVSLAVFSLPFPLLANLFCSFQWRKSLNTWDVQVWNVERIRFQLFLFLFFLFCFSILDSIGAL